MNAKAAIPIDRSAEDGRALLFAYRFGFAGEHGFINSRFPLNNDTVSWNVSSWSDQDQIPFLEIMYRYKFNRIIFADAFGGIGHEFCQSIKSTGGLANTPHFNPMTKEHDVNKRG